MGVITAQGLKNARELTRVILAEGDETIPACVRTALAPLEFLARFYAAVETRPSAARSCGTVKSRIGPLGTIPVGFMVRWLS